MARRVFARSLWRPCVNSVARGAGIGFVIAMCPVPMQMLIAGAVISYLHFASGMRLNLPAAVVATWTSNVATFVPICLFQIEVGKRAGSLFPWISFPPHLENAGAMAFGVVLTALAAGLLGYGAVRLFWDRFVPSPVAVKPVLVR